MLLNEYRKELFTSNNIFLILLSVAIFIFFELLFYWFIISNQIEYILNDKAMLVVLAARDDPSINTNVLHFITNNSVTQEQLDLLKAQRMALNWVAMINLLGPMFFTVLGLIGLIIIYKILYYVIFRKNTMTYVFGYTVFLTMFVFLVEILFYYLVINPWKIISDAEFIKLLTEPAQPQPAYP